MNEKDNNKVNEPNMDTKDYKIEDYLVSISELDDNDNNIYTLAVMTSYDVVRDKVLNLMQDLQLNIFKDMLIQDVGAILFYDFTTKEDLNYCKKIITNYLDSVELLERCLSLSCQQ